MESAGHAVLVADAWVSLSGHLCVWFLFSSLALYSSYLDLSKTGTSRRRCHLDCEGIVAQSLDSHAPK